MEKWKPTIELPDLYEVSEIGRVRRLRSSGQKTVISFKTTEAGYKQVCLWSGGKPHWFLAHRLAWAAFVSPIPKGMQINHKNGEKADNRIENLEVVTPSQNSLHKFRVLKHPAPNNPSFGEKNGSSKLSIEDVITIRALYSQGNCTWKSIANIYGVTDVSIGNIVRRKTWRHI